MTQKQAMRKQTKLAGQEEKLKKELVRTEKKLKKIQREIDRLEEKYELY